MEQRDSDNRPEDDLEDEAIAYSEQMTEDKMAGFADFPIQRHTPLRVLVSGGFFEYEAFLPHSKRACIRKGWAD